MVKEQGGEQRYPRVLVILGDYYAQKQDFPASAQHYQQYVDLEPGSPMAEQVRNRLVEWKSLGMIE
jgi:hypothetical protein